jgi:hypothetical protein
MYTDADGPAVTPGTLTLRLDHLRAGVPVVHASGCLDHVTAPSLQHLLDDQLATAPWAIVIDLSALSVLKPDAVPTLVRLGLHRESGMIKALPAAARNSLGNDAHQPADKTNRECAAPACGCRTSHPRHPGQRP